MKGIEEVSDQISKLRFRVSRLIDLERIPEASGKVLLKELIDTGELARIVERTESESRTVTRI